MFTKKGVKMKIEPQIFEEIKKVLKSFDDKYFLNK